MAHNKPEVLRLSLAGSSHSQIASALIMASVGGELVDALTSASLHATIEKTYPGAHFIIRPEPKLKRGELVIELDFQFTQTQVPREDQYSLGGHCQSFQLGNYSAKSITIDWALKSYREQAEETLTRAAGMLDSVAVPFEHEEAIMALLRKYLIGSP